MKNEEIGSYNVFMDPITGKINTPSFLPSLPYGYIWVGNKYNNAEARPALLDIKIDINTLNDKFDKTPKVLSHSHVKNNHVPIFTHHVYGSDKDELDDGLYNPDRIISKDNNDLHHKLETGRILSKEDTKYMHSSPVSIDLDGNVDGVHDLKLDSLRFNDYKDTYVKIDSEGNLVPADLDIPTEVNFSNIFALEDKMNDAVSLAHTCALIALAAATYTGRGSLHCRDRFVVNRGNIVSHNNFDRKGFMFCDLDVNQRDDKYKSYIAGSGGLVVSSTIEDKHMIKPLEETDALSKIKQLNVYNYCPMFHINDEDHGHDKDRKYYKSLHVEMGLLAEEVEAVLPEIMDTTKLEDPENLNPNKLKEMMNGYKPTMTKEEYLAQKNNKETGKGVNLYTLLCYTVMAVKQIESRLSALEKE